GFLHAGLALATRMVLDLCGGEASHVVEAGKVPMSDKVVAYRPERTLHLAGVAVDPVRQMEILGALGFRVDEGTPWQVGVPSWRRDIDGEADLVEEVVRIDGFDRIPSTPLSRPDGVARPTATPA